MVTFVLEHTNVSPQKMESDSELFLPLTFFDMFWSESGHHLIRRLFFYQFPCSKSHFAGKITPAIKSSLSQALKNFPAFAGTFVNPSGNGGMPAIRCKNGGGGSVDVVFAESEEDLGYFVSEGDRDSDRFYPFLPELKKPAIDADGPAELIPLLAVQVTLFPDRGVCIGLTNHHVVGDASTTTRFIKAWALICRHGGDTEFLADESLRPNYDRSLVNGRYGGLNEKVWDRQKSRKGSAVEKEATATANHGSNKVRATFVMDRAGVEKLKNMCKKGPDRQEIVYVSTFSVTCAYVWTCLARSSAAITGTEDGPEYFLCAADLRARMNPPLPPNYAGNAVYPLISTSERRRLIREDGFITAAKLIGGSIYHTLIENEVDVVALVEKMLTKMTGLHLDFRRVLSVAGSPLFDVYEADFGWGRPTTFELVSIDVDGAMSLCKSRDMENGLEITLSMEKTKMEAFAKIFSNGLK